MSTDISANFDYYADFSSAISQVKLLSRELSVLNQTFNSADKEARKVSRTFSDTFKREIGSFAGFKTSTVEISSSVDDFGKALDRNKLKLKEYYTETKRAFRENSNVSKLALDQVKRARASLVEMGFDQNGKRKGMIITPMTVDMKDAKINTEFLQKRWSIINKLISDGSTQLVNFGKNTQWAGRQLTVGISVPMAMLATSTVKAFNDMDRELTRFQKVYGSDLVQSVGQSTDAIRAQVQALAIDIAKQYGIAAKETAALTADLAATGLEGKNLLDSVKETTKLAVLGDVSRQEAMKTTLSLQNAFNMSTKELSDSINFLNAVENQTSVSLQDLSDAIPKVGPVIKALGGDVKDLSVLLVAMKEGGINAAEGANAIKSGLASLINPTKQASQTAKQYGIDLDGIVSANKGKLMPTIIAFQQQLNTLDEFGKAKVIEQIFGKYQFARISALFDNLNASGSQTQQVIKLMAASSSDLAKVANNEIKTLTESSSMRFQRAMEGIKASLLPVGETIARTVIPWMDKLSGFINKIIDFAGNLPKPFKDFFKIVGGVGALAGPIIMFTGVMANLMGYAIKGAMSFVNLGRKIKGLPTEKFELLDDHQIAAAKATDMLTISFENQKLALQGLNQQMLNYLMTIEAQQKITPQIFVNPGATVHQNPNPPQVKQKGGTILKAQTGAWVPGYGSGDKVPALLEPGEFVVNRNAANKYSGVLHDINYNKAPRFQNGGGVGSRTLDQQSSFIGPLPSVYHEIQGTYKGGGHTPYADYPFSSEQKAFEFMRQDPRKWSGSGSVVRTMFADPVQEAFSAWIAGNIRQFRKKEHGVMESPKYQAYRDLILKKMGSLGDVSLSRATMLEYGKHLPEFTDQEVPARILWALKGMGNLEDIIGKSVKWSDMQSFSTKPLPGQYAPYINNALMGKTLKEQQAMKDQMDAKTLAGVLFRFANAKGRQGLDLSGQTKIQRVMGRDVNEQEYILNEPQGVVESIAQDIATKMMIVNMRQSGGLINKLQSGGVPKNIASRYSISETSDPVAMMASWDQTSKDAFTNVSSMYGLKNLPKYDIGNQSSSIKGLGASLHFGDNAPDFLGLHEKSGSVFKALRRGSRMLPDAMVQEAFMSQLIRSGLFGPNITAIDQTIAQLNMKDGLNPMVLRSPFLKDLKIGNSLFAKNSRGFFENKFLPQLYDEAGFQSGIVGSLLGNGDLHSQNFGVDENGKFVFIDNTSSFLTSAGGYNRSLPESLLNFEFDPEIMGPAALAEEYLGAWHETSKDKTLEYLNSIMENFMGGSHVSQAIKQSTGGNKALIDLLNNRAIKGTNGKVSNFKDLANISLHSRLSKLIGEISNIKNDEYQFENIIGELSSANRNKLIQFHQSGGLTQGIPAGGLQSLSSRYGIVSTGEYGAWLKSLSEQQREARRDTTTKNTYSQEALSNVSGIPSLRNLPSFNIGDPSQSITPLSSSLHFDSEWMPFAGIHRDSNSVFKAIHTIQGANVDAMAQEAFLSQLLRTGLFGPNVTGIDQTLAQLKMKNGNNPLVLRSEFVDSLLRNNSTYPRQIGAAAAFQSSIAGSLLGNSDLHNDNFGLLKSGDVSLIDNTDSFLMDAAGNNWNLDSSMLNFQFNEHDPLAATTMDVLGSDQQSGTAHDTVNRHLDKVLGRLLTEAPVSRAIQQSTGGNQGIIDILNQRASEATMGKVNSFEEMMNIALHARIGRMQSLVGDTKTIGGLFDALDAGSRDQMFMFKQSGGSIPGYTQGGGAQDTFSDMTPKEVLEYWTRSSAGVINGSQNATDKLSTLLRPVGKQQSLYRKAMLGFGEDLPVEFTDALYQAKLGWASRDQFESLFANPQTFKSQFKSYTSDRGLANDWIPQNRRIDDKTSPWTALIERILGENDKSIDVNSILKSHRFSKENEQILPGTTARLQSLSSTYSPMSAEDLAYLSTLTGEKRSEFLKRKGGRNWFNSNLIATFKQNGGFIPGYTEGGDAESSGPKIYGTKPSQVAISNWVNGPTVKKSVEENLAQRQGNLENGIPQPLTIGSPKKESVNEKTKILYGEEVPEFIPNAKTKFRLKKASEIMTSTPENIGMVLQKIYSEWDNSKFDRSPNKNKSIDPARTIAEPGAINYLLNNFTLKKTKKDGSYWRYNRDLISTILDLPDIPFFSKKNAIAALISGDSSMIPSVRRTLALATRKTKDRSGYKEATPDTYAKRLLLSLYPMKETNIKTLNAYDPSLMLQSMHGRSPGAKWDSAKELASSAQVNQIDKDKIEKTFMRAMRLRFPDMSQEDIKNMFDSESKPHSSHLMARQLGGKIPHLARGGAYNEPFKEGDPALPAIWRWIYETGNFRKIKNGKVDPKFDKEGLFSILNSLRKIDKGTHLRRATILNPGKSTELPFEQQARIIEALRAGDYTSLHGMKLDFNGLSSYTTKDESGRFGGYMGIDRFHINQIDRMTKYDKKQGKFVQRKSKIGPKGFELAFLDLIAGNNTRGRDISMGNLPMGGKTLLPEVLAYRQKGEIESIASPWKPGAAAAAKHTKPIPIIRYKGLQSGGSPWVPGSGSGDRVPAMLEPGEFVVNKKAAMKYGGLLHEINFKQAPRFSEGGPTHPLDIKASKITGAATGIAGAAMMATQMTQMTPLYQNMGQSMQGAIDKISQFTMALTFALPAINALFSKGAIGGAIGLFKDSGKNIERGKRLLGTTKAVAEKSGNFAGATRFAKGAGTWAKGMMFTPYGMVATAVVLGGLAIWKHYRDEVKKTRDAMKEAFSVGEKTAQAFGVELTSINDKLKENQALNKKLGVTGANPVIAATLSEDQKTAIAEENKNLIDKLKPSNYVEPGSSTASGYMTSDTSGGYINNNMSTLSTPGNAQKQKSLLISKFATLRQQGFSQEDAMAVVTQISKDAGDDTLSLLNQIKPQLKKLAGNDLNIIFKESQKAQLDALKETTATGANKDAFKEAFTASVNALQYAPPEDRMQSMLNLINAIDHMDSTQVVQSGKALQEMVNAESGSKSNLAKTIKGLTDTGNKNDLDNALKLMEAIRGGMSGDIVASITADNKLNAEDLRIINKFIGNQNVQASINVSIQTRVDKGIDNLQKQIGKQEAKYQSQMSAIDKQTEAENKQFDNSQKHHDNFIKAKQKEIDSINKGTDAYINSLQKQSAADKFYQEQAKTAKGGLAALAGGDVFGFVQAQQQMSADASQYAYDKEISNIDEKRKKAVDAKQAQIDKEQELASKESENHQNRLAQLDAQRTKVTEANSSLMSQLQKQMDAYKSLGDFSGGAYDQIIKNYEGATVAANGVGAVFAAVDYLSSHPDGTVEDAIKEGRKFLDAKAKEGPGKGFKGVSSTNYKADGGHISGPGTGTSDSIPAMLSNGEYVIRASAVSQYGTDMLDSINTQKYAKGGIVLDESTRSKISQAEAEWGHQYDIVKGGYLHADKFSGSTHTGGGVFDAYYANGRKLFPVEAIKALRRAGFAAWNRWQFGANNKHLHAIEIGNPNLSKSASNQARSYLSGGNGLGGKDTLSNKYDINKKNDTKIPDESGLNLTKITSALGISEKLYKDVKINGLQSLLGRRFGGSMTMNKPYLVGENGPEVFMPYGSGGRIAPIKYNVPAASQGGIIGNTGPATNSIVVHVNGVNDPQQAATRAVQLINQHSKRRDFNGSFR